MTRDLLVARVAGERFAVLATAVQSVIELGTIVPIPRAPHFIAGMTTQRSRTLTVIDVSLALDLPAGPSARRFALVMEFAGVGYAFAVDAVENVLPADSDVGPLRFKLSPGWSRSALGMVETAVGTVLMVDLARLVGDAIQEEVIGQ
jgi:purine-binding chemotaxis protein CheW